MRIGIVGPGAVGGFIAARLAGARRELVLCARTGFERIELLGPGGVERFDVEPVLDPAEAGRVDWVLVCTKTYDSADAGRWLAALRNAGTPVAVLQNGVEHRDRFRAFVEDDLLVPVVVECPAERLGAGRVRVLGGARLTVADGGLGRAFASLFQGAAVDVRVVADFATVAWAKLCRNAAGAARAMLERAPEDHGGSPLSLARGLAAEAVLVGRAEGARLDARTAERAAAEVAALSPERLNSLEADLRAGRRTEIDARNGAVVRIGRERGIEAPLNARAVELLAERSVPRSPSPE